jgi:glycosyltransferase involved in cell wall biosynthesis
MDVFPDNIVALGLLGSRSLSIKAMHCAFRLALLGARRVVVLGSCMEALVRQRYLGDRRRERLVTVQNWADGTRIAPVSKESSALYAQYPEVHGKFIVQFFGNLGRLQDFDTLLVAAGLLQNDGVVFVLMGTGSEAASLEQRIDSMRLTNVFMWGTISSAEQCDALACCDVALITLREAALGVGVPSKLYPTMAMGRPVVAVVPDLSETASTVREGRFGYVVTPGHPQELASALMCLRNDDQLRMVMGQRSREMFERRFDKPIGTARYVQLVEEAIRG